MALPKYFLCVFALMIGLANSHATAQPSLAAINQKTLTVLSGEAQWFPDTLAISQSVEHAEGLRILPIHGQGCIESAADVLQLTQVDVAVLSADCVAYAQAQGLLSGAAKKLTYIARIRALPFVIVTLRNNANLTSLAGKRIATGAANSATFASGEMLLGGLDLPFVRVAKSGGAALELLKAGGVDAVLLQGLSALDVGLDAKRFHVLGLTAPQPLAATYAPALLDASTLNGLGAGQQSIETVSTSLLLAVYNWPKQSAKAQKIKQFTKVYFEQQAMGDGAQELSVAVPGWQRHDVSQSALNALTIISPNTQQGDGP